MLLTILNHKQSKVNIFNHFRSHTRNGNP